MGRMFLTRESKIDIKNISSGRATLSDAVKKELGADEGDQLLFIKNNDRIYLIKKQDGESDEKPIIKNKIDIKNISSGRIALSDAVKKELGVKEGDFIAFIKDADGRIYLKKD